MKQADPSSVPKAKWEGVSGVLVQVSPRKATVLSLSKAEMASYTLHRCGPCALDLPPNR